MGEGGEGEAGDSATGISLRINMMGGGLEVQVWDYLSDQNAVDLVARAYNRFVVGRVCQCT